MNDSPENSGDDATAKQRVAPRWRFFRILAEVILVIVIAVAGFLGGKHLLESKPKAQRGKPPRSALLVEVTTLPSASRTVTIDAYGTVRPSRRVELRPHVPGIVRELATTLDPGEHVSEGDVLLRLDDRDFRIAVRRARAALAKARSDFALEEGSQAIARADKDVFAGVLEGNEDLVLRKPQLAAAKAAVDSARASLDEALLALERTTVQAPFTGVIEERHVERGSTVSTNTPLLTLIGTEHWWVEAQVPMNELAWIRLPDAESGSGGSSARVSLDSVWSPEDVRIGEVVQTRPGLEEAGRLAELLVRVDDPLARAEHRGQKKLILNAWARVAIEGDVIHSAFEVPREYLRDGDFVWIMDGDGRLAIRPLEVAFRTQDTVLVTAGIEKDDAIVTSSIAAPVSGMQLRRPGDPKGSGKDGRSGGPGQKRKPR